MLALAWNLSIVPETRNGKRSFLRYVATQKEGTLSPLRLWTPEEERSSVTPSTISSHACANLEVFGSTPARERRSSAQTHPSHSSHQLRPVSTTSISLAPRRPCI